MAKQNKPDRNDAIRRLTELAKQGPSEGSHVEADEILLALINDPEIITAFNSIKKWYA